MGKRHNICLQCNKNYYGQGKMYCSRECQNIASKGKPQKKRSDETKIKISLAHKGKQLSEDTKQKISISSKKHWENDEYRKTQHKNRIGRIQSEETKEKIRKSNIGLKRPYVAEYNKNRPKVSGWTHTEESKKKISNGVSKCKNGMYGKLPKYNKPTMYINGDIEIKMRSTWEVKFAYWLDENGKEWEYEAYTFELSNGHTYTPDFFSKNIFYEVKGYFHKEAKEKVEMFISEYSNKKLEIVNRMYLTNLGIKL